MPRVSWLSFSLAIELDLLALCFLHLVSSIMSRSTIRQLARAIHLQPTLITPSARRTFSLSSRLAAESDLTHPALVKDPPASNPSAETDPWSLKPPPLAFTEEKASGPAMTMDQLLASPHPEARHNEPTETLRKRLVYESRKRGILEMDLILATFAKTHLASMDDRELREYDRVRSLPSTSSFAAATF